MATFSNNNPFAAFLEDVPEAGYFSYQNQPGRSPNQKRYFQQQFANVQNQYMGQLGQAIRTGGDPTQGFADYLDEYMAPGGGQFQDWASMSPRQRGTTQGRYAPPTLFNF